MWVNVRVEWQNKPRRTPIIVTLGLQPLSFLELLRAEVGILPRWCGSPQTWSRFWVCKVLFTSCCMYVTSLISRNGPEWQVYHFSLLGVSNKPLYLVAKPNKDHQVVLAEQPNRTNQQPTGTMVNQLSKNRAKAKQRISSLNYEFERNCSAFIR